MISKTQEYQGFHMVPRMISSEIPEIFNISYGTPYDFLRITKILKKHMIPPMIFDKTIQQYNIFV